MSFRSLALACVALAGGTALLATPSTHAQAAVFGFDGSAGATAPFSVTAGGNTATFASTVTGVFTVANSGFFSFGNALGDYGSVTGNPLTISFATPVTQAIMISFGLEDIFGLGGSDTLTATASNGQVVTAGTSLNQLFLAEPEGTLFLAPTSAISTLLLTSANPFAIANVSVPEPMSLSILGFGLAGLATLRRRRA